MPGAILDDGTPPYTNLMHIALLAGGDGWHVRDLVRAAAELGHSAVSVDFRRVCADIGATDHLNSFDAVVVRTMPPGSLEQVVFRMDRLHALALAAYRS